MTRRLRLLAGLVVALLAVPGVAAAQIVPPEPIPPWPCDICPRPDPNVVIADYRVEALIDAQVATTTVTQVFANRGAGNGEAVFLFPLPAGAAMTGLALWIDGEPVQGEVLAADEARAKYEEIVAFLRDPALLEFADQGLVRLSVFPIPAGGERTVRLEYTEVLAADQGLVRYRHPMGREAQGLAEIEKPHRSPRDPLPRGDQGRLLPHPRRVRGPPRRHHRSGRLRGNGRRGGRRLRPLLLHRRGSRRPQPARPSGSRERTASSCCSPPPAWPPIPPMWWPRTWS